MGERATGNLLSMEQVLVFLVDRHITLIGVLVAGIPVCQRKARRITVLVRAKCDMLKSASLRGFPAVRSEMYGCTTIASRTGESLLSASTELFSPSIRCLQNLEHEHIGAIFSFY